MKFTPVLDFALLGVLLCAVPQLAGSQSFAGGADLAGIDTVPAALNVADSSLYTDGTRAIDEGRWGNAEAIFDMVAGQHGEHAAGALYWKAYAQNKLGHRKPALATCAELRQAFPASSWIHECGALEIEIAAKNGKPLEPQATQDDDLKLLALNFLLQQDESRALAEIQDILNGNSSEQLKKEAAFLLGQHYSDATYPQIVRLRYVDGDVRISRVDEKGKPAGATWETAVADLPLETGFSLVTGTGRAEIEFEDASTVYLAENSVLTFNDLHTTSGVPYTDVALLTGTLSLNVHTNIAGERFFLRTPTESFLSQYPDAWIARVSSYLDGTAHTQQKGLVKNHTQYFRDGHLIDSAGPNDEGSFADWDKWVADRVAQRTAAMSDVMKASGLTSPIPGLADMEGQGTFFDCAPYGTCWEPPAKEDRQQTNDSQIFKQGPHIVRADFHQPARFRGVEAMQTDLIDPFGLADQEGYFPCFPPALRYGVFRDASTPTPLWNWAVCHAGSWVHRRHRYCWVVGHKRHHVPPIRWVKSGHKVAFVPIHPYDVKGHPPINRKEEVFAVNNKNGMSVERMKFEPGRGIEELKSPPREFRTAYMRALSRAEAPHMEAHSIREGPRSVALSFDPHAHSFMMPKQVTYGNKTATVLAPMTNRGGTLQASGARFGGVHSGITTGGASRSGGTSGGGGSHGGGASTGGGSHGGGGGGGFSGGGSHGGGGGSSGGSSGGASSGGGHR
jgi:FecR protein